LLIRSNATLAIDPIAAVPTLIDPIISPAVVSPAVVSPAMSWRRCGLLTNRFGNRLDNRLNVFHYR